MLAPIRRRSSVGKFRSKDGLGGVGLTGAQAGVRLGVIVSAFVNWEILVETVISVICGWKWAKWCRIVAIRFSGESTDDERDKV